MAQDPDDGMVATDSDSGPGPVEPACGNNIADGEDVCDGTDLAGTSCESLGFEQGELTCTANCGGYDLSGCGFFECGNGKEEGDEDCDGTVGVATCVTEGYDNGTLFCTPACEYNFDQCGTCGNEITEPAEECEANNLEASCSSEGFMTGQLLCGEDCLFDTSGCSTCGNDLQEGNEDCDGTDVPGKTCAGEGFDSGSLGCQVNCQYDFAACGTCGNALVDGDEVCDASDLGGSTCGTEGFDSGALACNATCDAITTDGCGVCGNGMIDGSESCEAGDLGGQTCASLGLEGGALGCSAACQYDIAGCDIQILPNLLQCGSSSRDVTAFIPPMVNLTVVMSCVPDANTQAMLITRNGVGLFDGATVQAYVEGGGNVLTETFSSDDVYNAVFGTALVETGLVGACQDTFPTVVQFSAADPFWGNNPFTAIPALSAGCGNNVTAYPALTPLAGWSATEVSVGYRDALLGRVWVTEFDWQDNEVVDFDYTAELMGAMIIYPAL